MKKIKNYIISFLLPITIFLLVQSLKGFNLNGSNLIVEDFKEQYIHFFLYLKNVLNGSESLVYSFDVGLGSPIYPNFAYFISSPLNIFIIFFNENNISLFIQFIMSLKIGLCGLTMYIYLSYKSGNTIKNLIFSLCYSLCSYVTVYYCNIMFLDGIYFLPLIALGIDKIIDRSSSILYYIALTFAIVSNYYIGYMLCISSVLYFIYKLVLTKEKDKISITKKYIIGSLLAGLSSIVIWLPTVVSLIGSDRYIMPYNFDFKYIFSRLFMTDINVYHNNFKFWNLNIYSSLLVFIFFLTLFFNKKISRKEKILNLVYVIIFVISFLIPKIDYVWHGFSYPNGYYYRYSFVCSFFLIVMAFSQNFKDISKEATLVISSILILFLASNFSNYILLLNLIFILLYLILFIFNIKFKEILFYTILIIELSVSLYLNLDINSYYKKSISSNQIQKFCDSIISKDGYRNLYFDSITDDYGKDIGIYCEGGEGQYFSSDIYENTVTFYQNTGMSSTKNSYRDNNHNQSILKMILATKYLYTYEDLNDFELIKEFYVAGKKVKVYDNRYALPIGFTVRENYNYNYYFNEIAYQNNIFSSMTGIDEDVLKSGEVNEESKKYYVVNDLFYLKELVYNINYDILEKGYEILSKNKLENIKISKNKLEANIEVDDDKILFLSIPYDKNIEIYVDGKKENFYKMYDSFIGVDLKKGQHSIRITYKNNILTYSIIINLIAIITAILYLKKKEYS